MSHITGRCGNSILPSWVDRAALSCGGAASRDAVIFQIELLVGGAELIDGAGQFVDARVTRAQQVLQSLGIGLLEL